MYKSTKFVPKYIITEILPSGVHSLVSTTLSSFHYTMSVQQEQSPVSQPDAKKQKTTQVKSELRFISVWSHARKVTDVYAFTEKVCLM
jgi:hypothetical protein